ncbi:MAG: 2-oxoglutarate dehydrogenase complex dihydrolipoyllysine-residue succinyltransferase [Alphaproteobacteria bacterium]|nr:2-oxoglutarate dehydrogenase complex dihydrolipoyllysine-residue succinyltransferase [Alphaproteobacteria bacterium]
MATDIRVPALGESVTEATVAKWFKKPGETVKADEPLCELETDKVTVEVPAPASGVLSEIIAQEGATVEPGGVLGTIGEGAGAAASPKTNGAAAAKPAPAPAPAAPQPAPTPERRAAPQPQGSAGAEQVYSPSVRKYAAEGGIDPSTVPGTGPNGRVTKGDVLGALESRAADRRSQQQAKPPAPTGPRPRAQSEERVAMTRLRRTIALRLKEAQNTAAMLTTFNEVDMSAVMELRNEFKDNFERRHKVKLGFMGFFVKSCIVALKDLPSVNAEIEGDDIVYKNYYDIGVAVGTDRGLVVPVVRDADKLSLAEIESTIGDFGRRARDGQLKLEELQGGTFTISNGGVYGSLMSTPILNTPQSGILGMHKIQQRAMVVDGRVEIRPMMYLALSYDHRLVDGREAVTFLVRVKECLESPQRMLLDL